MRNRCKPRRPAYQARETMDEGTLESKDAVRYEYLRTIPINPRHNTLWVAICRRRAEEDIEVATAGYGETLDQLVDEAIFRETGSRPEGTPVQVNAARYRYLRRAPHEVLSDGMLWVVRIHDLNGAREARVVHAGHGESLDRRIDAALYKNRDQRRPNVRNW